MRVRSVSLPYGSVQQFVGSAVRLTLVYFAERLPVSLVLYTQEEVVTAVTALDGEYTVPILQDVQETRTNPPPLEVRNQDKAEPPVAPPPIPVYQGADFADPSVIELGLDSRGQLRRLQDYLAPYHLMPVPVSLLFFKHGGV